MLNKLAKIGLGCGLALLFTTATLLVAGRINAQNPLPLADEVGLAGCPSTPTISFTPTNPNPGQQVTFTGAITSTGGGGVITFTWNFGDGSSAVNATTSVQHTYRSNGVYTVSVTATGQGCAIPTQNSAVITVGFGVPTAIIYLPLIVTPGLLPTPTDIGALPAQITGLTGQVAAASVRVSWPPDPGYDNITAYRVYRLPLRSALPPVLLATLPVSATSFVDAEANCGYAYTITAVNQAGESMSSAAGYFGPECATFHKEN